MKMLLITPYDNNYRYRSSFTRSLSYMPLTLPYLASLTPKEYHFEFKAVDEGVERCAYDQIGFFDIVAITAVTSSVKRGYELADYFRKRGSHIVMGGHHVSLLPDEAAGHADTVITGPADKVWPEFIRDFVNGSPGKRYEGSPCDIGCRTVVPMREILKKSRYIGVPTVIANFGCANRCDFCVIHSFWGGKYCTRKIEDVIEEIRSLKSRSILFLDPSPTSNPTYAKKFFTALIPLKIRWAGLCTTDVCEDEELFDLMIRSGCVGILMGFESFREDSLRSSGKKNQIGKYKEVVDRFHHHGVSVLGTFILGFDQDTAASIKEMPKLINMIGVDIPRFAILTPYPNTPIYRRLDREGRILSKDWNDYDSIHATYVPKQFSAQELERMLVAVSKECYSFKNIFKRALFNPHGGLIKLGVNIGFRIYNRRIGKSLRKEWKTRHENHADPSGDR